MFKDRMRMIPQAADDLKALAQDGLALFDRASPGARSSSARASRSPTSCSTAFSTSRPVGQPLDPATGRT